MFLPFKFQSYCRKAETAGRKWARGGRSGRGKSDSPWSGGRLGGWGQTVCTCRKSHRYCSHCRSSLFVVYFQFSHLICNSNDSSTSSTLHMHTCSLIHLYTYHMHVPTHKQGHRHICTHTHTHTHTHSIWRSCFNTLVEKYDCCADDLQHHNARRSFHHMRGCDMQCCVFSQSSRGLLTIYVGIITWYLPCVIFMCVLCVF